MKQKIKTPDHKRQAKVEADLEKLAKEMKVTPKPKKEKDSLSITSILLGE